MGGSPLPFISMIRKVSFIPMGITFKSYNWESRRSRATAGVPSSRLGHFLWDSRRTRKSLDTFFSGFFLVFSCHKFHPTISPHTHTHLIHFVSFHYSCDGAVRRGLPASLLFRDLQLRGFIASHPLTHPFVGLELSILYKLREIKLTNKKVK